MFALTCYYFENYRNVVLSMHRSRRAALVALDEHVSEFAQIQLGAGKEIPHGRGDAEFYLQREAGNPDRVTIYKRRLVEKVVVGYLYNTVKHKVTWDPLLSYDVVYLPLAQLAAAEALTETGEASLPNINSRMLASQLDELECFAALNKSDGVLRVSELKAQYPRDFGLAAEPVRAPPAVSAPVPIPGNVYQLLALEAITKREEIMGRRSA